MKHSFVRPLLFTVMILFVAEDLCFLVKTGALADLKDEIGVEEYQGQQEKEEEGKQEKEEKSEEEAREKDKDRHMASLGLSMHYTRTTKHTLEGATSHPASAEMDPETPPPEGRS